MSVPTAGQLRVVIVGATGMVGGYALSYALEHRAALRREFADVAFHDFESWAKMQDWSTLHV